MKEFTERMKKILDICMESHASDLLIKTGLAPAIRVNGKLLAAEREPVSAEEVGAMLDCILSDYQKGKYAENMQADSSFRYGETNFRCNVFRDIHGDNISVRRLNLVSTDFNVLGIPEQLKKLVQSKSGMLLITGPTGSGKSTTMACLINYLNQTTGQHIITLEDPIEYVYTPGRSIISQREVGRDVASFQSGLTAALRQDPDVILVGEMRDKASIEIALTAAETGHLVLSTLHTTGTVNCIDRILSVFNAEQLGQIRQQFAMVLLGVLSQQLIPAVGGGMVLGTEFMVANSSVRGSIRTGKTAMLSTALQLGKAEGMYTMDTCLEQLFQKGRITKEQMENYKLYR